MSFAAIVTLAVVASSTSTSIIATAVCVTDECGVTASIASSGVDSRRLTGSPDYYVATDVCAAHGDAFVAAALSTVSHDGASSRARMVSACLLQIASSKQRIQPWGVDISFNVSRNGNSGFPAAVAQAPLAKADGSWRLMRGRALPLPILGLIFVASTLLVALLGRLLVAPLQDSRGQPKLPLAGSKEVAESKSARANAGPNSCLAHRSSTTSCCRRRFPGPAGPPSATRRRFCPELCVPDSDCDCILLVPIRRLEVGSFNVTDPSGAVVLQIAPFGGQAAPADAAQGSVSLASGLSSGSHVSLAAGLSSQPRSPRQNGFRLMTAEGLVLGECREAQGPLPGECQEISALRKLASGSALEFEIIRPGGQLFAWLGRAAPEEKGMDRYVLTGITGERLSFSGYFQYHAVTVTAEDGAVCATTEVCGSGPQGMTAWPRDSTGVHYHLHAAPHTDMALVLCGLLAIDHLAVYI